MRLAPEPKRRQERAAVTKDGTFPMFPRTDHSGQIIWRDIVPVVALALALVLTFWTRHYDDLTPYSYSVTAHTNYDTSPGYAGPRQADEPAEQKIVLELLHQHALRTHRIERLGLVLEQER
jgi:hypothetical protein